MTWILIAITVAGSVAWVLAWEDTANKWNASLLASLRAHEETVLAAISPDPFKIFRDIFRVVVFAVSIIIAAL